jgi:hypothetical protein
MGFLSPWFFAGLALLSLPVWLHLLQQHRSTPLKFASLMFFERRTQSSIKHRRLRYLLLFALRCLVLFLLVLAFMQPFVKRPPRAAGGGRKLHLFAIDNSFSMRQGDRLARAREQAVAALSMARGDNRGQVLAFAGHVRMMSDQTADAVSLRAAARAVQPSDERSSYAELARAVRSVAQSAKAPVELHVFSDLQKSSMPPSFADMRLGDGVRLTTHQVGSTAANYAVENVAAPRRVFDPKRVRVQATLAAFAGDSKSGPAQRRVALLLNGKEIASKTADLPANGRASVEFTGFDAPHGLNRGEVRIESGDSFAADDTFFFSMERVEPRRALFVHEARNGRGLLYFRTALESAQEPAFQIDEATPDQVGGVSPDKYAFVVLSDVAGVPAAFEDALRGYVRNGGSVLVALGGTSTIKGRVSVFDEPILDTRYAARDGERFQSVAYLDSGHPSIQQANRWSDVKFYQAVHVEPGKSRIAAKLSDDTPLLLEKKLGEGRVLVFASTFDNIANDFPLHPSFVPFIEQTARYLGRLEQGAGVNLVGSHLELRSVRDPGASVEVLDPAGARALSLAEAAKAESVQLTQAGFYDIRRPSGRHELVAVNADRHESDLTAMPAETLELWKNTGSGGAAAAGGEAEEPKPFSLWWYVMLAVLALVAAESLLANRHLSIDKEAA